jgi:CAAX protease family protein
MTFRGSVGAAVRASLVDRAEPDLTPPDRAELVRRRVVAGITLALGTVLLFFSLAPRSGDPLFYALTAGVAVTWTVGGLLSGPLHLGRASAGDTPHRPILVPLVTGLLLAATFVLGALVVREIPPLREPVERLLAHARHGSLAPVAVVTIANGVAEEIFFRGGLYAAAGRRHPVAVSTVVYALVTCATGNPMLVFAALILGLVLALQRRASGGLLAPIITHVTWSTAMLLALPPLFPG